MPYGIDETQWEAASEEMRRILHGCARGGRTITYGELASGIAAASLQPRSAGFFALLADVCDGEESSGRPCLGPLVVRKDTQMPGEGFFAPVEGSGDDRASRESYWESGLASVFEYWREA